MLGGFALRVAVVIVVGLGARWLGRSGSGACGTSCCCCCGASRLAGCGLGQSLIALQIAHVLCEVRRIQA